MDAGPVLKDSERVSRRQRRVGAKESWLSADAAPAYVETIPPYHDEMQSNRREIHIIWEEQLEQGSKCRAAQLPAGARVPERACASGCDGCLHEEGGGAR